MINGFDHHAMRSMGGEGRCRTERGQSICFMGLLSEVDAVIPTKNAEDERAWVRLVEAVVLSELVGGA